LEREAIGFWLGWLVDRKLRGDAAPAVRRRWLGKSLYAVGFSWAILLLLGVLSQPSPRPQFLVWLWAPGALLKSPRAHLVGREIVDITGAAWGGFYTAYFGWKLRKALAVKCFSDYPTTKLANYSVNYRLFSSSLNMYLMAGL